MPLWGFDCVEAAQRVQEHLDFVTVTSCDPCSRGLASGTTCPCNITMGIVDNLNDILTQREGVPLARVLNMLLWGVT